VIVTVKACTCDKDCAILGLEAVGLPKSHCSGKMFVVSAHITKHVISYYSLLRGRSNTESKLYLRCGHAEVYLPFAFQKL
jgi:hypothetical protein